MVDYVDRVLRRFAAYRRTLPAIMPAPVADSADRTAPHASLTDGADGAIQALSASGSVLKVSSPFSTSTTTRLWSRIVAGEELTAEHGLDLALQQALQRPRAVDRVVADGGEVLEGARR